MSVAKGQGGVSGYGFGRCLRPRPEPWFREAPQADERSQELCSMALKPHVTTGHLKQAWSKLRAAISGKYTPGFRDLVRKGECKSY